jgi:SAM-dependent methyltransferase
MNPAEFANIAACERDLWWFRGQRKILESFLEPFVRIRRSRDVLEAGCGTGYQSSQFSAGYGWRMFPIDLEAGGLSFAQAAGVPRLTQADIANLPFADAVFDAVVSLDVLVHFPRGSESAAVRELTRVLRRGGLLVIRVSALDILRSRHSQFADERQRFTRGRLVRIAEDAGVRPLRCTYANGLLFPVALAKFRIWEPLTRQPPASGVTPVAPWLDRALFSALSVEARLIGAGFNLPVGQSLLFVGEKT